MPTSRDTALSWARLALDALFDPTPAGLARAALAQAIRLGEARREAARVDPQRLASRVGRELGDALEPFLEHEAGPTTHGGRTAGAGAAVDATVERLLARHAPDARRINELLRDPRAITRRILRDGARELSGLGPDTEVPVVEALLLSTYRVLLRQEPVLDALRADYERRQLRRGRRTAETLETLLKQQRGLLRLVRESLRQTVAAPGPEGGEDEREDPAGEREPV